MLLQVNGKPIVIDGVKVEVDLRKWYASGWAYLVVYETSKEEYNYWFEVRVTSIAGGVEIDDDILKDYILRYFENRFIASLDHKEMININGYNFCMYDNVLVVMKDNRLVYAERNETQHNYVSGKTPITMDTVRIVLGDSVKYEELVIGNVESI